MTYGKSFVLTLREEHNLSVALPAGDKFVSLANFTQGKGVPDLNL
jgi:hypothetical protein